MKKEPKIISTFVCFIKLNDGIRKITVHREPVHFHLRKIKNEISKGNFVNYLFMSLVLKRHGCE